jgi:hypothetical protein
MTSLKSISVIESKKQGKYLNIKYLSDCVGKIIVHKRDGKDGIMTKKTLDN